MSHTWLYATFTCFLVELGAYVSLIYWRCYNWTQVVSAVKKRKDERCGRCFVGVVVLMCYKMWPRYVTSARRSTSKHVEAHGPLFWRNPWRKLSSLILRFMDLQGQSVCWTICLTLTNCTSLSLPRLGIWLQYKYPKIRKIKMLYFCTGATHFYTLRLF